MGDVKFPEVKAGRIVLTPGSSFAEVVAGAKVAGSGCGGTRPPCDCGDGSAAAGSESCGCWSCAGEKPVLAAVSARAPIAAGGPCGGAPSVPAAAKRSPTAQSRPPALGTALQPVPRTQAEVVRGAVNEGGSSSDSARTMVLPPAGAVPIAQRAPEASAVTRESLGSRDSRGPARTSADRRLPQIYLPIGERFDPGMTGDTGSLITGGTPVARPPGTDPEGIGGGDLPLPDPSAPDPGDLPHTTLRRLTNLSWYLINSFNNACRVAPTDDPVDPCTIHIYFWKYDYREESRGNKFDHPDFGPDLQFRVSRRYGFRFISTELLGGQTFSDVRDKWCTQPHSELFEAHSLEVRGPNAPPFDAFDPIYYQAGYRGRFVAVLGDDGTHIPVDLLAWQRAYAIWQPAFDDWYAWFSEWSMAAHRARLPATVSDYVAAGGPPAPREPQFYDYVQTNAMRLRDQRIGPHDPVVNPMWTHTVDEHACQFKTGETAGFEESAGGMAFARDHGFATGPFPVDGEGPWWRGRWILNPSSPSREERAAAFALLSPEINATWVDASRAVPDMEAIQPGYARALAWLEEHFSEELDELALYLDHPGGPLYHGRRLMDPAPRDGSDAVEAFVAPIHR